MDKKQFKKLVVEPTLKRIPRGYSEISTMAVMLIVAHETNGYRYIAQIRQSGNYGPALGGIQMEPATHDDVWRFGDSVWVNAVAAGIITVEEKKEKVHPPAERLIYDLCYNVFMARQRLFMKSSPLPKTLPELSAYLKKHWNTVTGEASDTSYLSAYEKWK